MAPPHKKRRLSGATTDLDSSQVTASPTTTTTTPAGKTSDAAPESTKQHNRSLFVRSLPKTATTASLTELFSAKYPIKHATAVLDKATQQCKGYGFVTFADAEDAVRAREEFDGFVIEGRKVRVEIAEARQRDQEARPGAVAGAGAGIAAGSNAVSGFDGTGSVVKAEKRKTPGEKIKEAKEAKRKEEAAASSSGSKIIVRNLPWSVKEAQLEKMFLSFGKVKRVQIIKKAGGLMAGFAFVTLRGRKNAEKAVLKVNGKEVDGRTLAVDFAVEKEIWKGLNGKEGKEEEVDGHADEAELDDEVDSDEDEMDEGSEDFEDGDEDDMSDIEDGEDDDLANAQNDDKSTTLFIRNLPFTCSDEDLEDQFRQFGAVRYARIVLDHGTERPKGTGFVCFYNIEDADTCVKTAPRFLPPKPTDQKGRGHSLPQAQSILQDEAADPSGKFTMDGRILQVARAVAKTDANRLTQEGVAYRNHRDRDKRRLYLLQEGTISTKSSLYDSLSPSERTMREASAKQRKQLIESNPSLHLSLTRLSVRNIPRTITSKDLKQLAREAVVGFAKDVKDEKRQRLSKEELARGGDEMLQAEKERRQRAKGVVKQAKIVFEGKEGAKVEEKTGAGRSRGYGFIEYYTHRSALMGLRWLNGYEVGYAAKENEKAKGKAKGRETAKEMLSERKKRLIVEFAIENAQVVMRRKDREGKMKERGSNRDDEETESGARDGKRDFKKNGKVVNGARSDASDGAGNKRKRGADEKEEKTDEPAGPEDEKLAKRQRIIQKKRMMRRARKSGGGGKA